ncbi:hypothetical protein E3O25_10565 [Cryobacterium sp. TMT1-3]|uniref:DUF6049 family protein n=1 Tax=Cryobacterium sp. TMT1-3 TaxID=1259237 RepID=UPI001069107D|nr:DUF6049 family protein [Cryobacterium sp. TMT1-3]TFC26837.1 hypothetical protein E3O25_10565 [Cryobacterium sp. TMT1-3]
MVADSDSAHRPALSAAACSAVRPARRRQKRRIRRPFTAVLVGFLTLASLIFAPTPSLRPASAQTEMGTASSATTPADTVGITVSPRDSSELSPGQDLLLTVAVHNNTDADIPVGRVDVYLADLALTTRAALDSWLRPSADTNSGDQLVSVPTAGIIPAGAGTTVSVTVPAESVGLTDQNAWGARGIAAILSADDVVRAEGRGTFVWSQGSAITPVALTTILPITTPASATGLITAKALESYTSSVGLLSRQLDAAIDAPTATIAIDPQIIASIRVLGTAAPASALAWLDRLAGASNDIFPLSYADADIAVQAQAGAPTLLAPTSFDPAIDASLFVVPPSTPAPETTTDPTDVPSVTSRTKAQTSPSPTPSPTPTVEPGQTVIPSTSDLLAWNYTSTAIGWPAAGQVARSDLDVFAASGLTTTILSSGNVEQSDVFTPNTAVTLPTGLGLVSDSPLSAAIRAAAEATTDEEWRVNVTEAASLLAIVSAENPDSARTLLVTFDRSSPATATRIGQTLTALDGAAWSTAASLQSALAATPATTVTFQAEAIDGSRVTLARSLLEREGALAEFATILADPVAITAPARLDLLALLDTTWTAQTSVWEDQVRASLAASFDLMHAVTVTTRGPIIVVGSKVDLRITLNNALDQAVTVRTEIVPSNGRLVVGETLETIIQPNSAQAVSVPLSAAVGNGDVVLRVTLFTLNGTPLGQPAPIDVSVRADWEGVGATIFAILVIGFFGFGIWRNIVGRRRERAAEASAAAVEPAIPAAEPDV